MKEAIEDKTITHYIVCCKYNFFYKYRLHIFDVKWAYVCAYSGFMDEPVHTIYN